MVIVADSKYNPDLQTEITASTLLGPGVSVGNFLVNTAHGTSKFSSLTHIQKLDIVRNLVPQVELINSVNGRTNKFPNHRLAVVEGIYFEGQAETADELNLSKSTGNTVVYALYNRYGEIDISASFDLAVYWKEYFNFNDISLSYDTINPDGTLNANIIVTMPTVPNTYDVTFTKTINTYYNNTITNANELAEFAV